MKRDWAKEACRHKYVYIYNEYLISDVFFNRFRFIYFQYEYYLSEFMESKLRLGCAALSGSPCCLGRGALACFPLYILVCLTTRVYDGWWEIRSLLPGILCHRGLLAWSSHTVTSASPMYGGQISAIPAVKQNRVLFEFWFNLWVHELCCHPLPHNVSTIS